MKTAFARWSDKLDSNLREYGSEMSLVFLATVLLSNAIQNFWRYARGGADAHSEIGLALAWAMLVLLGCFFIGSVFMAKMSMRMKDIEKRLPPSPSGDENEGLWRR